jgi:hypothetical protein
MTAPQYRILQTGPIAWELDRALVGDGGWRFVGSFDSEIAAQTRLAELVAADAWKPSEPQYFDATGQALVSKAGDLA